jgi:hypothetical protein
MFDLLIWGGLALALVIFAIGPPGKGGALALAYFLSLSLIHVPGVLPFIGSDPGFLDADETKIGFELTVIGMAAFVVGSILAGWMGRQTAPAKDTPPRLAKAFGHLSRRALVLGIVAYFVALPLSKRVPSLTSITAALGTLLTLGFWLALYAASVAADRRRTLATLALLPLLPVATLVAGATMNYAAGWVLSIFAFLFVIAQRRIWFYFGAPIAVFLTLSLFVTYMSWRSDYRAFVQTERTNLSERLDRVWAMITEFQLFDLGSPTHLAALDDRLNQNWLVGAGIIYHESGGAAFAYGGTVPPWAFIPRALWPSKPEIGGSGSISGGGGLVSDFTGIRFAEDTSVGVGQVLEFYINFGIPGVLIGFFGLGYLLMRLDLGIMRSLVTSDGHGLLLRAMPGLTLLNPGGSLLEMIVGSTAAYLTARLVISLRFFDVPQAEQWSRPTSSLRL